MYLAEFTTEDYSDFFWSDELPSDPTELQLMATLSSGSRDLPLAAVALATAAVAAGLHTWLVRTDL